ncbi:DUF3526 domain-containing protein [Chitinophaga tropicalis]|uniref:DUF3526 domain-containing protein n=1 Tax=Chitinophaga tropicalis TaxID=2683588 RepID=A0A7K1U8J3_9BACT|nr:DUF3526 domain-containing protein [Chitinophaga tropicalis]MVT10600.1 DUF3526 domain-containing protein [Chitinophaga tropicalis]
MTLFLKLLAFEWQWLLRYRLLLPVTCLVIMTAGCALYYGNAVTTERRHAADSVYADYQHRFDSLLLKLCTADTLTGEGKTTLKQLSHPVVVQFQLKPVTVLPAAPLSMLSIGMSDMEPWQHRLELSWSYMHGEEKISNPLKLLTGNFDLSFLLIYIFPLLLMGITYNILSREKELGTYTLILVQQKSILPLLTARLLLRWLLFFVLFTLPLLIVSLMQGGNIDGIGNWMLITAAYLTFWSLLLFLVISFNRSSAFNVILMTGIWLLLLVLLPALSRYGTDENTPGTQTATVAAEQREQEWALWDLPQKQLLDSFYAHYPRYKDSHAYDTVSGSSRRTTAYYDLVARRMERFTAQDEAARQKDLQALLHSYRFNPAVYAQSLFNLAAHTDATDYLHYEEEVKAFHRQWKEHFFTYFFHDRNFTPEDYHALPTFQHKAAPYRNRRIYNGVGYLLLLSAICGAAGTFILKKKYHS